MSKILILGATGNIAGLTAKALSLRYPEQLLRLTSSRESGASSLHESFPEAEIVMADWYDTKSLIAALEGIDKVLMVTPDFVTDEERATSNIVSAVNSTGNVRQILRFIAIPPGLTASDLSPEVMSTRCGAALHTLAKPILDNSGLPVTYLNAPCWINFNVAWFLADEIKKNRRLAMPPATDAPRLWIAEQDIADVAAELLVRAQSEDVGREYIVTGTERFWFSDVADMLSDVLGETVVYEEDDKPLRKAMGDYYDDIMTYFSHETRDYADVEVTNTVQHILQRPQVDLKNYLQANRYLFA